MSRTDLRSTTSPILAYGAFTLPKIEYSNIIPKQLDTFAINIYTMFGQIKDLYNLQKQAREMKKQLEAEQVTGVSKDETVHISLNGSYDLLSVKVNQDAQLTPGQIEENIKQAYEEANSQIKSILMEKFKGMM